LSISYLDSSLADLRSLPAEALGDRVPVDRVPPGGDVIGALVLVLEVVGVLPDVHAQDGRVAVHQRAVLVGPPDHRELAAGVPHEPAPAAAELADGGLGEGFLEAGEVAEGALDGVRQPAARL